MKRTLKIFPSQAARVAFAGRKLQEFDNGWIQSDGSKEQYVTLATAADVAKLGIRSIDSVEYVGGQPTAEVAAAVNAILAANQP